MEVIMPGFNRLGPLGEGPMTGRKMGRCNPPNSEKSNAGLFTDSADSKKPEAIERGHGRGRCMGRGHGWGMGRSMRYGFRDDA